MIVATEEFCRVCGLKQSEPTWTIYESGNPNPSHDICACCGIEFGYEDAGGSAEHCKSIRKHWIEVKNKEWFCPDEKPENWSWENQKKILRRNTSRKN